jgi:hypothetical protein
MTQKKKMVTAVFRNQVDAERAFEALQEMGYLEREIDVLMSEKTRADWYLRVEKSKKHEAGTKAAEPWGQRSEPRWVRWSRSGPPLPCQAWA